jgi:hypothetical protein
MRHCFFLLLFVLGAAARPSFAQTTGQFGFAFGSVAKIVQGTDTLPHAWVGGLNTPQFSSIDFDGDGRQDLYAFDRQTTRSYTFLNVAGPTGRSWQYAPDYEGAFPSDLQSWVALRDYDCDGRPDLFTYASGGNIRVFHNVAGSGGRPQFVLANDQLSFTLTPTLTSNLNTGFYNMPSIQDVNGDGRLDILSYDFVGSTRLELYLNTGKGTCTDLNSFSQVSNYWGQISACADCASYLMDGSANCLAKVVSGPVLNGTKGTRDLNGTDQVQHSMGHNLLLLDLNGDGVLDLLDGRDNCPQLSRLLNAGSTTVEASFTYAGTTSNFPLAAPLSSSVFPAPYSFDADLDGVPDLLVTPNMVDNSADRVSMRHTVRQFRNTGTATIPSYAQVSDGFLQNDMLDVSEGAAPAFGDLDGDGLTDMLVGNQGDLVNGYYRASLYYYRNVGTARRPVFRLVTEDYLSLAATAALTPATRFETLRPALVDLNRDGALDLVYSVYNGTTNRLTFILNKATASQPASFDPTQADYFRPQGAGGTGAIATRQGDTPCFFDVDGDGYVDLLLGTNDSSEPGYSLRYFRNQGGVGTATNSLFVLANADYGMLRVAGARPANLSATVADFDGNGHPDLLTVDGGATMRLYTNFRNQGTQFTERTDVLFNSLTSQYEVAHLGAGYTLRFAPATADLDRDGTPELYVGTETGGVISYLGRNRTALANQPPAAQALALSIYPNPTGSADAPVIETAQATTLRLFDLTGRLVRQDPTPLRRRSLDVRGLAPGIYVVQATAPNGTNANGKLVIK